MTRFIIHTYIDYLVLSNSPDNSVMRVTLDNTIMYKDVLYSVNKQSPSMNVVHLSIL